MNYLEVSLFILYMKVESSINIFMRTRGKGWGFAFFLHLSGEQLKIQEQKLSSTEKKGF